MRIVFVAQVAAVALLVSGCPNAPSSDPTGGSSCPPGTNCSSTGGEGGKVETGGAGGVGGKGGGGGAGNSAGSTGAAGAAGAGGANTGGNGSGGAGNAGGSAGNGGAGAGGNGSGGSSSANCNDLFDAVLASQDSATTCNIEMPQDKQCKEFIDGLCCPIAVNNMNSPEVIAYLQALQAYLNAGCIASCPPVPCPQNPKASCMGGAGSSGDCVVSP